jgi:hypothetical protein
MQPLPLVPPGSVAVAEGVAFLEDDERTGTVFIWGQACFTWDGTDPGAAVWLRCSSSRPGRPPSARWHVRSR